MKISYIFDSLWLSGGVRDTIEQANRLVKRSHAINFVIPWGTLDPDVQKEITPEINIIQAKIRRPVTDSKLSLFEKIHLTFALALSTPTSDIVISTHTPTTVAGYIAAHILRRGKPVWYYQDYIEMYEGKPLETWLARNALRWHDLALVLSNDSRTELESYVSGKKVVVSGAGLSHAEFFKPLPKEQLPRADETRKILFLGDMRPRKGLFDFLEAAEIVHQQIKGIHLWIVSKEECQIETHLPFDYFYRPARSELARLYAICDIFVSASWWESFGLPPIEAMASGAPVVMTATRGGMDYAQDGKNCLLVPPRQPLALAEAMVRLLQDGALEEKLRRNGPPTAANFSWDAAADRFEAALIQVLEKHGK